MNFDDLISMLMGENSNCNQCSQCKKPIGIGLATPPIKTLTSYELGMNNYDYFMLSWHDVNTPLYKIKILSIGGY